MFQTNTFFGTELMVAPIVEKMDLAFKSAKVDVWFPEGDGMTSFREKIYRWCEVECLQRHFDYTCVCKSGAIIPLVGSEIDMGVELPEVQIGMYFQANNILLK